MSGTNEVHADTFISHSAIVISWSWYHLSLRPQYPDAISAEVQNNGSYGTWNGYYFFISGEILMNFATHIENDKMCEYAIFHQNPKSASFSDYWIMGSRQ